MTKDLKHNIGKVLLMEPADKGSTDFKTNLLDTSGFESANVNVIVGALTGVDASNYLTLKLQESDTTADADFTDVAAGNIIGAFTVINSTSKDSVIQTVGYKGIKRYIRVLGDYTGTGISAGIVGVVADLGNARVLPVTAPAPVAAT